MLTSTFCLTPSGHTCTTRRFYDAIAAGCLPIVVDCELHPYPFEDALDYSLFVIYAPISAIGAHPSAFVHCLRRLNADTSRLRQMRVALAAAREELIYGWWGGDAPPSNVSLASAIKSGAWRLARHGRVLENLIRHATLDKATRPRPVNWWERGGMAGGGDVARKGRHAETTFSHRPARATTHPYFDLVAYCGGMVNNTSSF